MSDNTPTPRDRIADILDHDRKWPDASETADAIIAALPDMIEPLVWVECGSNAFMQDADFVDMTQTYQIQEGIFWYAAEVHGTPCGSNATAKAAANAHHRAAVMAAFGIVSHEPKGAEI